jgi:hypothetical protein
MTNYPVTSIKKTSEGTRQSKIVTRNDDFKTELNRYSNGTGGQSIAP